MCQFRWVFLVGVTAVAMTSASCTASRSSSDLPPSPPSTSAAEGEVSSGSGGGDTASGMHSSWTNVYPTLREMGTNADAIAIGQVSAIVGTTVDTSGIPYTDFSYVAEAWLKGGAEETILIHQTGGQNESGTTVESDDDPLLAVGEQSLVFLKQYAPGQYFIMGGPTGRLLEANGLFTQLPGASKLPGLPAPVGAVTSLLGG